ncbi:hypothetical protein Tco_0853354 [Tanacetum coccineum]
MTRSAGRSTTSPRSGRTGRRTGKEGGRAGEPTGRGGGRTGEQDGQGDDRGNEANGCVDEVPDFLTVIAQQLQNLLPTFIAQVGNRVNNQRNNGNQNDNVINDNIQGDVRNTRGQEAAVGMTWEDFKALMREELCPNNELQKLEIEFWCYAMVEAGHAAYTDRFHELVRLVPHLVTPENKRIERNKSLKKNSEKRGNGREPSKDGNFKGDNKRSRTKGDNMKIMPPRMMTQSTGRSTATPRGGRMGGRTGRGGGRTGEPTGRAGGRTGDQDGQGGDRGNHASNIQGDVRNVSMNNGRGGCSYKEFLACNPKDYDGNGGVIVYTRWTEKMESVHDMSGCGYNQKVKYTVGSFIDFKALMKEELYPNNEMQKLEIEFWCHVMVKAGHAAYTDRFHELDRLVPHLVTPENKKIERVLTDEAIKNGSLRKNTEKRGNGGESSRDGNVKDDNKRSKTIRIAEGRVDAHRLNHFNHLIKGSRMERVAPLPIALILFCLFLTPPFSTPSL